MKHPILRTKLYIPSQQLDLVQRQRLSLQINQGLNRKLTLISAPAGFGKTTLLSEWIPDSQRRVAWLSLEEADNDPARFWAYFLAALQMIDERIVRSAQDFVESEGQVAPFTQAETFLTILLNDISACAEEIVFVFDDFHHIHNPPIHKAIGFLLDHLPPQLHLVIACRADPPLPLAQLRARGQITELRVDDLRFTTDEAVAFLNEIAKLGLSTEDIAALETRTEGWIAGLQLAAISMQKRTDTTQFIKSFTGSHRFIMDYLVDEVLRCQAKDIQTFLLETAILDRFTSPLCDAVTGREDGQEILRRLEQANLFIILLDGERRWYRYHRLFADLLRARLAEAAPERITELHQRACGWFEKNGLLPEAIQHALIIADFEQAARLIERAAETLRQNGEVATLTIWFNALPADIQRAHPHLCLAYARALVDAAQETAVEAVLADAAYGLEKVFHSEDPESNYLRGQWAALTAYLEMNQYHFDQVIELSQHARQLFSPNETRWLSFVALNLAGAYRFTSHWAEASQTYLEASALSLRSGDKVNALAALSMRGEVLEAMGLLHAAVEQFEQVLQLAQALEIPHAPVTGYALIGLARAWYEWNDLKAAAQLAQKGLECGKKAEIMDILLRGYLIQARIKQTEGDLNKALAVLENLGPAVYRMGGVGVQQWVNAIRAHIWLARGDTMAASGWASTCEGKPNDTVFPSIAITLARVHLAQDRTGDALGVLEHALQSAHAVGREGNAVQIMVVKAKIYQAQGLMEAASTTLHEALALAEPEDYRRVFLDEGEPMRALLTHVQAQIRGHSHERLSGRQKKIVDYIAKLLAVFPLPAGIQIVGPAGAANSEALSERELEILRLLANGLSRQDIAARDVVSVNTVKTQVKSIFEKLGAHTREQAISAARSNHLL